MKENRAPDIIFIGQPNTGKSTLFNAISGFKAETSNFPGTTVKHAHSKVNLGDCILNIIDLPGTYSLQPSDPAEKVVLSHLFLEKPDVIINVVDASILGRNLELTVELLELKYPMIIALNMIDLAEKKGIKIYPEKLEELLGIPVICTIATHGRGVKELLKKAVQMIEKEKLVSSLPWSKDVEEKIKELERKIPEDFPLVGNRRFTAIKMIEAKGLFFNDILEEVNPSLKKFLDKVRSGLEAIHNAPAYEVIAAERHHLALKIFEESSKVQKRKKASWQERVDNIVMHPFLGYFVLVGVFLSFFFLIFKVGSPLEGFLLGPLENLRVWLHIQIGSGLLFSLADGFVMGVGGGLAVVLPFFIPLVFLMSFLEDVGYLARAGYMMDTFMHRLGIHGKSVAPFILGFGCNVPAIVSVRILESRRDRIITSLLIPFIPCSARTTIILALVAFYLGPIWALGFYFFNIIVVALLGRIISFFLKGASPGLILEIPDLKIPSLKNIVRKTYIQLKSFLKFAWPILIAGSIVLGFFQYLGFDKIVNAVLSPLVEKGLGLPREVGITLIFGFLRKELSLIMMLQSLGVSYDNLMTVISRDQIIVFALFINLFIPCLSTFAILWKEAGKRIAFLSAALNTGVAVIFSFIARIILSR